MGADALCHVATHSDSAKLFIQVVAFQGQNLERAHADPARIDPYLTQAVRMLLAAAQWQDVTVSVAA
jgi:hypothetical protein